MKYRLLNDGEPDENGDIIAIIENRAGQPSTTYKAKSHKELNELLLKSQVNANRIISRLQRPDKATTPQPITLQNHTLTPTDKLRLANEITDPDKVVDAVTEIVTAAQNGVSPGEAVKNVATMTEEQYNAYCRAEAIAFMEANPDYYPVDQNKQKIFAALIANKWDFTRNNLGIAFQSLADQGEMIAWPSNPTDATPASEEDPDEPNGQMREAQPSPEPNPPSPTQQTRPRSVSIGTGLRSSDASAAPPLPPAPKKLTRADIERMPRREYMERLSDPQFRKAVDALA